VKEILGTCVSVGCSVDGKSPMDLQEAIDEGGGGACQVIVSYSFAQCIFSPSHPPLHLLLLTA